MVQYSDFRSLCLRTPTTNVGKHMRVDTATHSRIEEVTWVKMSVIYCNGGFWDVKLPIESSTFDEESTLVFYKKVRINLLSKILIQFLWCSTLLRKI